MMEEELDLNSGINLRQSPSRSSTTIIASGPPPPSSRHAHEQIAQRDQVSKLDRVLKVLQRAARRIKADPSFSQSNIFRSLAPLAVFVYLIGIGVLLPRQQRFRYSKTRTPEENTNVPKMILLFFIGTALALAILRGLIWLVAVFGEAFCEVDLAEVFKRGECVDVNGRGMGEAELIVGGMFM